MMTLQDTLRRLAKRRLALCMTWAELAKASGVAEYTIRCWFDPAYCPSKKGRDPKLSNVIAVANALGFDYRLEYLDPPIVNDNGGIRYVHRHRPSLPTRPSAE